MRHPKNGHQLRVKQKRLGPTGFPEGCPSRGDGGAEVRGEGGVVKIMHAIVIDA